MSFFLILLPFLVIGSLPARRLGRAAAAAGGLLMLALLAVTLLAITGPDSDTSIHETNWDAHGGHPLLLAVVAGQLVLALALGSLAIRRARPGAIRALAFSSAVVALVTLIVLAFAFSS